jgi:hypothetical protein
MLTATRFDEGAQFPGAQPAVRITIRRRRPVITTIPVMARQLLPK